MDNFLLDFLISCLKVKVWLNIQIFFHLMILKRMTIKLWVTLKTNENNSIKVIGKKNLTEQTKFWLNEIIAIENYFYQEINERKS